MTSGVVFDIREFTIHDGPGVRTTTRSLPGICMRSIDPHHFVEVHHDGFE